MPSAGPNQACVGAAVGHCCHYWWVESGEIIQNTNLAGLINVDFPCCYHSLLALFTVIEYFLRSLQLFTFKLICVKFKLICVKFKLICVKFKLIYVKFKLIYVNLN